MEPFSTHYSHSHYLKIYTTSRNPKANSLVERFHRVLKEAFKAQLNPGDWYSNLGWILLSLHVTFVEHSSHCPAEILYGCPLRLPGEFFEHHKHSPSEDTYVQSLQKLMNQLTATPIRTRSARRLMQVTPFCPFPTFLKMDTARLFNALTKVFFR